MRVASRVARNVRPLVAIATPLRLAATPLRTIASSVRSPLSWSASSSVARVSVPLVRASAVLPSAVPRVHAHVRAFAAHAEVIPGLGDSISEGTLSTWHKKAGEYVARDDVIATIDTDKLSTELRATASGTLKQLVAGGTTVKPGTQFASIDTDGKAPAGGAAPVAAAAAPVAAAPTAAPVAAAPKPVAAAAPAPAAAPKEVKAPVFVPTRTGERNSRREALSRMRLTIAGRLKGAQNTAAMLTTFQEIDMTNIMALREKYKTSFEAAHQTKLGFMSVFVKASANALLRFPAVNAYYDEKASEIEYHDFVDIGVAIATPTGLVVPNLRNVEVMSFRDIEAAIAAYGVKGKAKKIAMEDMQGGTFTISNGGVFGSLFGTPIINPPQSAILGMHAIFRKPWVVTEGKTEKIEIRPIMVVALTYDHRIIDGATAVQFLKDIKLGVEDPSRMLLDL